MAHELLTVLQALDLSGLLFVGRGLGGEIGRRMKFKMEFDANVFCIDFLIWL